MPNATALAITVFTLDSQTYLAQLLSADIIAEAETVKAEGAASRYKIAQQVKQEHKCSFRVMMEPGGTGETALCNLDVSVVTLSGSKIAAFQSGTIKATTVTKDPKIAANGYRSPIAVGTDIVFDGEFYITSTADLVDLLMTGTASSFNVTVTITYGGETFSMPGLLKAATHVTAREELQVQKVTLELRGTPTNPPSSATSLLGLLILGSAAIGIDINTGFNEYSATTGILTQLTTTITDAQLIEQSGELVIDGPFTVA